MSTNLLIVVFIIAISVPLALSVFYYLHYRSWRKYIEIRFGKDRSKEFRFFGPRNPDNNGKKLYSGPSGYGMSDITIFEDGVKTNFIYNKVFLGHRFKRLEDIESVYIAKIDHGKKRFFIDLIIETVDLKYCVIYLPEEKMELIVDLIKGSLKDRWDNVYKDDENEFWSKHHRYVHDLKHK